MMKFVEHFIVFLLALPPPLSILPSYLVSSLTILFPHKKRPGAHSTVKDSTGRSIAWFESLVDTTLLSKSYGGTPPSITYIEDDTGVTLTSPSSSPSSSPSTTLPYNNYASVSTHPKPRNMLKLLRMISTLRSLFNLSFSSHPPIALCACSILRTSTYHGDFLIVTKRITKGKTGTFNGMWVFPGGHTDLQNNKSEGLLTTASRECSEELGYSVNISPKPLCVYQACLWSRARTYFITFFTGECSQNVMFDKSEVEAHSFPLNS
ncbi:hypothetical protein TrLO_g10328 [Triparma laevis f. longispina]|uniref:Nudix hydrolase domain-containing protein n=1 Tax=Triparma laevis f. longispina TaxID=1714387 RepID=A0A9W6ZQP7_9STRA|nr:hypothetical protein TrLO_g10328 [Triparma laevis f. longispina]